MSNNPTLFEISDDMDALADIIERQTEGDEDAADLLSLWISEMECALVDKVDRIAAVVAKLKGRAEMRKAEAARLAGRADVDAKAAARLLEALRFVFEEQEIKTLETAHYRVTLASSGARAVDIPEGVTPEALRESWDNMTRHVPERFDFDKKAIADHIKEHGPVLVDGKAITLREASRSIRIR